MIDQDLGTGLYTYDLRRWICFPTKRSKIHHLSSKCPHPAVIVPFEKPWMLGLLWLELRLRYIHIYTPTLPPIVQFPQIERLSRLFLHTPFFYNPHSQFCLVNVEVHAGKHTWHCMTCWLIYSIKPERQKGKRMGVLKGWYHTVPWSCFCRD